MQKFKGTPGPWFWESDVLCNVDFIVGGKHHQFNHRNRDLIAAAPELLEACLRIQAHFRQAGIESVAGSLNPIEDNAAQIDAVILKALGR